MILPRRALLIGVAAVAACGPRAPQAMDLDAVLAQHTQARGGEAALDAVQSVRTAVEIVEPTFSVNGRYIANTAGLMRVDIFAGEENVFSEGLDSEGAWSWQPGGEPQPASAAGEAALRHGVEFNLFGLHRFAERGHALALEGREEIEGVNYYVIKVVLNDGFETYRYIDPTTWMITRSRDVRAVHPDVDATEVHLETQFAVFAAVSGVQNSFSWRQLNLLNGEDVQRGRVAAMEYNAPLAEADFARARRA